MFQREKTAGVQEKAVVETQPSTSASTNAAKPSAVVAGITLTLSRSHLHTRKASSNLDFDKIITMIPEVNGYIRSMQAIKRRVLSIAKGSDEVICFY